MKRRDFIAGVAGVSRSWAEKNPLAGDALFADVQKYWSLGEHRTGSAADHKTTEWLNSELKSCGFDTKPPRFEVPVVALGTTRMRIGGQSIPVFPLWPVQGSLHAEGALGPQGIAVARLPYEAGGALTPTSAGVRLIQQAAAAGASALVLVTEGPTGEVIALNHESGVDRWPIPVVLIGPKYADALVAGVHAVLDVEAHVNQRGYATNAQGLLKGAGGKLIVVSTPKSGWFRCAGERGPGIALWLGLARSVARQKAGPSFLFTANGGHELHGLGMKAFLDREAPKPANVACWIHLGAGIATYASDGTRLLRTADPKRYLTCTPDLVPVIAPAFRSIPELAPSSERYLGELRYLAAAGYSGFSVAAGHRLHHTPIDDPSSTGPAILAPVAQAFQSALELVKNR